MWRGVARLRVAWLGWPQIAKNSAVALARRGYVLKVPGAQKRCQEAFARNSKLFAQTRFWGPTLAGCGDVFPCKNLVKIGEASFRGLAIEEPVLYYG